MTSRPSQSFTSSRRSCSGSISAWWNTSAASPGLPKPPFTCGTTPISTGGTRCAARISSRVVFLMPRNSSFAAASSFALAEGETANPPADSAAGMFAAATAFFKNFGKTQEQVAPPAPPPTPPVTPANDNDARFASMLTGIEQLTGAVTKMGEELKTDLSKLRGDHDALKASIDTTDEPAPRRNLSTGAGGGTGRAKAEC